MRILAAYKCLEKTNLIYRFIYETCVGCFFFLEKTWKYIYIAFPTFCFKESLYKFSRKNILVLKISAFLLSDLIERLPSKNRDIWWLLWFLHMTQQKDSLNSSMSIILYCQDAVPIFETLNFYWAAAAMIECHSKKKKD